MKELIQNDIHILSNGISLIWQVPGNINLPQQSSIFKSTSIVQYRAQVDSWRNAFWILKSMIDEETSWQKRNNRNKQFSLSTFVPYLRRQLNSNPVLMKAVSALELFNLLCGVDNIAGLSSTWTFYVVVLFNLIRHQFYPETAVLIWPVSSLNGFYPLYLCMHPTVRIWRT